MIQFVLESQGKVNEKEFCRVVGTMRMFVIDFQGPVVSTGVFIPSFFDSQKSGGFSHAMQFFNR